MELLVLRFEFLTAQHSPQVTVQQLFPVIECELVQQQGQPLGVVVGVVVAAIAVDIVIFVVVMLITMTMSIMRIMRMMEMMMMVNESFHSCS